MDGLSLSQLIPIELVERIYMWMRELDRVDEIMIAEEKVKNIAVWFTLMEDIRANTPLYSLIFEDSNSNICNMNFILPDCDTGRLIDMLTLHQTFEEYTLLRGVHRQYLTLRRGVSVSQE
jgi:hypothetical protein